MGAVAAPEKVRGPLKKEENILTLLAGDQVLWKLKKKGGGFTNLKNNNFGARKKPKILG